MAALGIGERLRSAREARGLSLDEIEATTRIRRRYLEALETEAFDRLPGSAYARGFLRTYASYLGLPAEDLVGMYPDFRTAPIIARGSPVEVRITPATPQSRARRIVTGIAVLLAIAMVLLAYMLYGQLRQFALSPPPGSPGATSSASPSAVLQPPASGTPRQSPPPATAPAPEPAPSSGSTVPQGAQSAHPPRVQPTEQQAGAPVSGPKPPATTTQIPSGAPPPPSAAVEPGLLTSPLRVSVVANDRSWVRTVADGVAVFEGFLNAGDHQVWQARRELTLRIGNASAVDVTVNGRSLGRLGNPGDVVDKAFAVGVPTP